MPHLVAMLQTAWNVTDKLIEDWFAVRAAADGAVDHNCRGARMARRTLIATCCAELS